MRPFIRPLLGGLLAVAFAGGATASAAEPDMPLRLSFEGTPVDADNHLHTVARDGSITYGILRIESTTEIAGTPVGVEVQGNLQYVDGSGPFWGTMTFEYPSGDVLGLRYDASVISTADGSSIAGSLLVIGGTGALGDVTGAGTVVGTRTGPVGTPVRYEVTLDLVGLPDPAPAASPQTSVLADPDAGGLELMDVYSTILVEKDVAGLDALLAEGFVIQRTDGSRATKEQYLADLPDLTSFSFAEPLETRSGDVLIIAMVTTSELVVDGQPYRPDPAPMMAVWAWQDGSWRLASQSNFNLPR